MALFSLAGMVVGIILAVKCSAFVAVRLSQHIHLSGKWLPVIAFLIILIGATLLVRLLGAIVEKTAEWTMLGTANKLAGALLYILLYGLVFSILLFYGIKAGICEQQQSGLIKFIEPAGPTLVRYASNWIPLLGDALKDLDAYFGRY